MLTAYLEDRSWQLLELWLCQGNLAQNHNSLIGLRIWHMLQHSLEQTCSKHCNRGL